MPEEKREPKTIHVDKLIIKADEVVFQQNSRHPHSDFDRGVRHPVRRDIWGFPIPGTFHEQETRAEGPAEEHEDAKAKEEK
ncbi:hypothetical protein ABNN70_09120 [Sporolactobacillus sp. Y61]|uniref:Uncharacterized protein n=1 Tax=Sporolactobacillus sp. Y61 TaxID=3160863 RepID=A0AAU8ICC2_9BACL|nr:hypothetical protein [Sporolactobacillus sp. THM19-2]RYL90284.1 hypothetical protein EWH91_10010 [Sporolactobacillus sp. THM19-2]